MQHPRPSSIPSILCLLLVATFLLAQPGGAPALAAGPCDSITGDPRPPSGPNPVPLIGGIVADLAEGAGVSGATVELYRCVDGSPSFVGSATTNSAGAFSFGSLTGPDWYYVEVLDTGPLSGMQEAGGTLNPSSPVDVGPGDGSLVFEFES